MKSTALAIASVLALSAGAAQAQSSVTLFGLVDTGVEYINNVGPSSDRLFRMPTLAGSFASRWGMRGSEDLGGGLKANFHLESGFGADSGVPQQGNRIFGRQLFVGLSGNWGALTMGRLYSQLLWTQLKTDPFMASVYGPGAFDTFLAGPRLDNAIAYNHKVGGLSGGLQYSLGRDNNGSATPACAGEAAGDRSNCSAFSVNLFYEGATWGVGGYVDDQNNAAGDGDQRRSINGYFTLGKTKLMANYLMRDNEFTAPSVESTLWSIGASHPLTANITLEAAYYDLDVDDTDNDSSMLVLRGTYAFSKRTATYVYLSRMMNDGAATRSASIGVLPSTSTPGAGENQTALMVGLRHSF